MNLIQVQLRERDVGVAPQAFVVVVLGHERRDGNSSSERMTVDSKGSVKSYVCLLLLVVTLSMLLMYLICGCGYNVFCFVLFFF